MSSQESFCPAHPEKISDRALRCPWRNTAERERNREMAAMGFKAVEGAFRSEIFVALRAKIASLDKISAKSLDFSRTDRDNRDAPLMPKFSIEHTRDFEGNSGP
jgi:hypothetical protein